MSKLTGLARCIYSGRNLLNQVNRSNVRLISTSKKTSDATCSTIETAQHVTNEVSKKEEVWEDYGFDNTNKELDRILMHMILGVGIIFGIVLPSFYSIYAPHDCDWHQREAYLELRRRETLGIPLIDKNYVDESQIVLPSDDELGDTEIML